MDVSLWWWDCFKAYLFLRILIIVMWKMVLMLCSGRCMAWSLSWATASPLIFICQNEHLVLHFLFDTEENDLVDHFHLPLSEEALSELLQLQTILIDQYPCFRGHISKYSLIPLVVFLLVRHINP
jgi:hypothetical protein